MEQVLKRYFWAVWLAFLAVAAFLVARTANTFVQSAIDPPPIVETKPLKARPAPAQPIAMLDATSYGRLFGIIPPPPAPEVSAPRQEETAICWTCAPVKTNLRLQLLATMVATPSRYSMALVSDLDRQVTDYLFIGDSVKNAKVHDIIRDPARVVIVNEETHRLEYIDAIPGTGGGNVNTAGLGNLGTAPVPPAGEPGANMQTDQPPGSGTDYAADIKQKSENEYSVPKASIDKALGNLNEIATTARIVPSFKNGAANGFKLFSIRPGSLYSAIGVQNGDVITRINGFDMNSPDKALEIYGRLKDAKNVEIDIERRGQVIKKRYSIE